MKRSVTCPKCGCKEIIADAKALDRNRSLDNDMAVVTYEKPQALIFKGERLSTVSAWICADCGYIEYYADQPRDLLSPAT